MKARPTVRLGWGTLIAGGTALYLIGLAAAAVAVVAAVLWPILLLFAGPDALARMIRAAQAAGRKS